MSDFRCEAPYQPTGDQPQAIAALVRGLEANLRYQTLLGATGTGKTHTIARVIERVGRPTLVLAHNKTLAAQLCNELRSFFPHNAVEYFISYYDYYQPEAYIPVSDTYIAKTASINDEIDMLRHSATRSLFERRDVIVVASISCIYGLGIPSEYLKASIPIHVGEEKDPRQIIRDLVNVQYSRNDLELGRGRFRIKGDVLEVGPAYEDRIIRVEFFGDEIDAIRYVDPVTGEILQSLSAINIYPARHFVTPEDRLEDACNGIKQEMDEQLAALQAEGKLVEAQRLDQRTRYDLEMLREVGYCNGVENYSRHLAGRGAGEPPECLLDYFPKDWLLVMDESHVTVPQLRGMYNGDQARKKVLIDHGFRLPSAADNRPLKAEEFWTKVGQCIFVSATPGDWELEQSSGEFKPLIAADPGLDLDVEPVEFERSLSPSLTVSETKGQYDSDSSNPKQCETSLSETAQVQLNQAKTSSAKTSATKTGTAKTGTAKTSKAKTSKAKTSKAKMAQANADPSGHTTAHAIDSSTADATAPPPKAQKPMPKLYQRGTGHVVEQVIRPTGVVDPEIFVRPTEGQVDDLYGEIQQRVAKGERTLITTLTKRMAEDLTEYFQERSVRVRYLHSEISSIERIEIIQDLRDGVFDVLIGVNLLREGLDLPEVSLVAILDADKEGFLRAERSLIQTIGRAARHVSGQAILYADNMTNSMARAIAETERRREIQIAYNEKHGITPQPIAKRVGNSILAFLEVSRRLNAQELATAYDTSDEIPLSEIPELITQLEAQMKDAAKNLEFEEAAKYRDKIKTLREKLVGKR